MSAMTGIVTGLAVVGGLVAVARIANRHAKRVRASLDAARRSGGPSPVGEILDYEFDGEAGVYRQKP